jgi:SAM-dependent methyltransferase
MLDGLVEAGAEYAVIDAMVRTAQIVKALVSEMRFPLGPRASRPCRGRQSTFRWVCDRPDVDARYRVCDARVASTCVESRRELHVWCRAVRPFHGAILGALAPVFINFARLVDSDRVLDVGCGPGALACELVGRLGSASVCAVDPLGGVRGNRSGSLAGARVERAVAEVLPFEDRAFDAALAQLVVHFMADPVAGLREMGRVPKARGVVAACVWDHAGGHGPLGVF